MSSLPLVTIHTDGACSGNPGPGGWGSGFLPAVYQGTSVGTGPAPIPYLAPPAEPADPWRAHFETKDSVLGPERHRHVVQVSDHRQIGVWTWKEERGFRDLVSHEDIARAGVRGEDLLAELLVSRAVMCFDQERSQHAITVGV